MSATISSGAFSYSAEAGKFTATAISRSMRVGIGFQCLGPDLNWELSLVEIEATELGHIEGAEDCESKDVGDIC